LNIKININTKEDFDDEEEEKEGFPVVEVEVLCEEDVPPLPPNPPLPPRLPLTPANFFCIAANPDNFGGG
jgi:hypothetical protein